MSLKVSELSRWGRCFNFRGLRTQKWQFLYFWAMIDSFGSWPLIEAETKAFRFSALPLYEWGKNHANQIGPNVQYHLFIYRTPHFSFSEFVFVVLVENNTAGSHKLSTILCLWRVINLVWHSSFRRSHHDELLK